MDLILSPSLALLCGGLALLAFLLYRATFPTPIPGVPYLPGTATKPFGDVPEVLKHHAKTQEIFSFILARCRELNSPIFQVFVRPLGRPWVIVADAREAQDIMARRTREFDRSDFFGDLFQATLPHNQVTMKTNDQWRWNRRLMADTMSPAFLQNVAGPRVGDSFAGLLDLWREKCKIAGGRPIEVTKDIDQVICETIFATAFGSNLGVVNGQLQGIRKAGTTTPTTSRDQVISFPETTLPEAFEAILTITNSTVIPMNSPAGRTHHKLAVALYPSLKRAMKIKNELLKSKLDAAWQKMNAHDANENDIKCATDLIVEREVKLAAKEGRAPQYDTPVVRDELYGFLMAGHDTTSTTTKWGLKLLTMHQAAQKKLRASLRDVFKDQAEQGRIPSATEIAKTHTSYLDATIEEILRCGQTVGANIRTATQDTVVLGHAIPKGTDVFLMTSGPSINSPALSIPESKRSKSSQLLPSEDRWTGNWDEATLGAFEPERWLQPDETTGEKTFDRQSGPQLIFGGGVRGCFGSKLARLSLRIIFAQIVWTFELQPVPAELGALSAKDVASHAPQFVYVRLGLVDRH